MRCPRAATALLAAAALLLGACGGDGEPAAQPPDGDWLLVEGTGPEGEIPIVEDHPITLSIEGEEIGGTAACNSYGGQAVVSGDQLTLREIVQTEMACPGEGVMDAEAAYLDALLSVHTHERDGERLELLGEDTRLVFEPRGSEPADDGADDGADLDPDAPVTDEPGEAPADG